MRNLYVASILISVVLVSSPRSQEENWVQPQSMEGINIEWIDYFSTISANEAGLYAVSTRSNNEDIYVSERINLGLGHRDHRRNKAVLAEYEEKPNPGQSRFKDHTDLYVNAIEKTNDRLDYFNIKCYGDNAYINSALRGDSYERASSRTQKNTATALVIALIPGFFVHGLGHSYIGDAKAFHILFAAELTSITMMGLTLVATFASQYGGKSYPFARFLFFTGASVFVLTWVYDIIGAPIKLYKKNKMLALNFEFTMEDIRGDSFLMFKINHNFR